MSRRIVERKWENRNLYLEKGDLLLLLEEPTKPLITARTRHGRNIKIPVSILARDNIDFNCQLCPNGPFRDYAAYTAHLIEEHFREQLMAGLDFTSGKGGMPSCPFPVCSGTLWASLQALLMHYASHHHVLEKLMMYESEIQCAKYRTIIDDSREQLDSLNKKVVKMEQQIAQQEQQVTLQQQQIAQQKQQITQQQLIQQQRDEECKSSKATGSKEGMDIEVITGIGSNKEDVKPNIKKLIKFETETVTNIENQTLKKEYIQIKREKEKAQNALNQRTEDLEKLSATLKKKQEDFESEMRVAVENGRKWKETCLQEEDRYTKEIQQLKEELAECIREIDNLKNIIEIGKSTVENAKQLATELDKDNRKRQANEQTYLAELNKYQDNCKILETRLQQGQQEILSLRDLVSYQSEKLELKTKEHNDISNSLEDLSGKYKNLLEVLKRKDVDIESMRNNMENCAVEAQAMNTTIEENLRSWQTEKQAMQHEFRKELEIVSALLKDKSDNIKQLQEEVSIVRLKMEDAKKEARNLTVQVMQWKEKYDEAREEITTRDNIIVDTEAKLADTDRLVGEWRQTAEKKQHEISEAKKSHDAAVSKLEDEQLRLTLELEIAKANRCELDTKLTEVSNNLEQARSKLNSRSRNEEEIRKRCEKMSAELKVQGWEIDNYKRRLISSEIIMSSYGGLSADGGGTVLAGKLANFSPPHSHLLHHGPSPSTSSCSSMGGGAPPGLSRDQDKMQHCFTASQDFIVPSLPGGPMGRMTPDTSLMAEQEEYCENNNAQIGERLLEASEVKQEINVTQEKEEPIQELRDWSLKRSNSCDSDAQAADTKKIKK